MTDRVDGVDRGVGEVVLGVSHDGVASEFRLLADGSLSQFLVAQHGLLGLNIGDIDHGIGDRLACLSVDDANVGIRRRHLGFTSRHLELDGKACTHEEGVEAGIAVHRQHGVGLLYSGAIGSELYRTCSGGGVCVEYTVFSEEAQLVVDILFSEGLTLTFFHFMTLLVLRIGILVKPLV